MVKDQRKVVAAVMGAVSLYIQAEEEAARREEPIQYEVVERLVGGAISPWVLSGRQTAMEMRRLLQMRLLR